MKRKDKKKLFRIIAAAVAFGAVFAAEHFALIPKFILNGFDLLPLLLYLIPYFIIGYDILWKAARNIIGGQVFDENFLMTIATVGAFAIWSGTDAGGTQITF